MGVARRLIQLHLYNVRQLEVDIEAELKKIEESQDIT